MFVICEGHVAKNWTLPSQINMDKTLTPEKDDRYTQTSSNGGINLHGGRTNLHTGRMPKLESEKNELKNRGGKKPIFQPHLLLATLLAATRQNQTRRIKTSGRDLHRRPDHQGPKSG